jgi:hypothetical protein
VDDLTLLLKAFTPIEDNGITFDDEQTGDDNPEMLHCQVPHEHEQYALRWTFKGAYTGESGSVPGNGLGPTGNYVEISGFSILDVPADPNTDVTTEGVVMRYVDWLGAYAQLGIIEMRRPSVVREPVDSQRSHPAVIAWPPTDGSGFLPQV